MNKAEFETFPTWEAFLCHLSGGGRPDREVRWIWYKAPLDYRARFVHVRKVYKNGKVRIDPCTPDADPFTADAGHLDRISVKRPNA